MKSALEIRLLDEFAVLAAGAHLFPTRKTALLLAYLATNLGKAVPRERLKALLWSDRSEQQASGSLRRALSDLRKVLASASDRTALVANASSVTLPADTVDVDVARFEMLLDEETEASWAEAAQLYQGNLLADVSAPDPAYEDWLRIERERLRTIAVSFAENTVVRSQSAETVEAIAGLARRMLRDDPASEEAHRTLIVALRRAGRQNAAIKQYAACVEAMRAALEADPEARTKALLNLPLDEIGGALDAAPAGEPSPPAAEPSPPAETADAGVENGDAPVVLSANFIGGENLTPGTRRETAERHRIAAVDLVAEHDGVVLQDGGDRLTASFASPVQAVLTAVAIQLAVSRRNADLDPDERVDFQICVALGIGDAEADTDAASLREIAGPAGICVTSAVRDRIAGTTCCGVDGFGARPVAEPNTANAFRIDWREMDSTRGLKPDRAPVLPAQPSIAVMPFANLSEDPEHAFLADALAEDIITALSRFRWFVVIARNSSFAFRDRAMTVQEIARELGVRYVLEGSLRRIGDRVRVTGQLIEAESGTHLWAEHFDRELTDIFAIQDELTQNIVGAIEPELLIGESVRAKHKAPDDLDAYEYCMRALWHHHHCTGEHLTRAIELYHQALSIDPAYARPYVGLTRSHFVRCQLGFSKEIDADRAEMEKASVRAVERDERDAYCHFAMFLSHLVHGRHHAARTEAQRAIDLNPNFALGYLGLGRIRTMLGQFDRALGPLETAMRLSPRDPTECYYLGFMADAYYQQRDYKSAVHCARRALVVRRFDYVVAILAAGLGQLGMGEEARRLSFLSEITMLDPAQSRRYREVIFPYLDPTCYDHLLEGLEKAGITA